MTNGIAVRGLDAGQPYILELVNVGTVKHEFTVEVFAGEVGRVVPHPAHPGHL